MIGFVQRYLGTKYCRGGRGVDGIDCIGLVLKFYEEVYKEKLPDIYRKDFDNQGKFDRAVELFSKSFYPVFSHKKKPGDIVLFKFDKTYHVGIVISQQQFIHAEQRRGVVIQRFQRGIRYGFYRKK